MHKTELIKFENCVKQAFLEAKIRAPIHLSAGNESKIIRIFNQYNIKPDDWVFSTHRSHLHALLHGVPKQEVFNQILTGYSMHINSRYHKFVTSAIVCGCVPIAVGVAMAIKRQSLKRHVWCFVGDMAASTGIFHENTMYAARQDLPITFIVEDNGLSTNTPTAITWGDSTKMPHIIRYEYDRTCPHINAGQFVTFK